MRSLPTGPTTEQPEEVAIQPKTILCPTDFSDPAHEALLVAADMARDYDAELVVAHVVQSVPTVAAGYGAPSMQFDVARYQSNLRSIAEDRMKALIEELVPDGVAAKSVIDEGEAAPRVVALAEEVSADLVVLSTHGETGLSRLLWGSVAERVVRQAACPVLVVPREDDE